MKRWNWAPVAFIGGLLVLLEVVVRTFQIPEYLLPPPSEIATRFDLTLLQGLVVTAGEAVAGFLLASILAFAVAILFVRAPVLERGLFPIAITLKTTPIVAIAPLLVLWLGSGIWSKIAASSLICFFPVLVNTVKGLKAAEGEYLELFQTLGAREWQVFLKLRIPNCLPYLMSALKISSSLAIVGAVVGEFVGATQGLGYLIVIASAHLETATVFAATFSAAMIGIVFFQVLNALERRIIFWQTASEED